MWWSASIDMTAREASDIDEDGIPGSVNNPNTRWANPAPVYAADETRKLHAKTMILDEDTVIVGSANWSANGEDFNDENTLIFRDAAIANQFVQEFWARYQTAGGQVPPVQ